MPNLNSSSGKLGAITGKYLNLSTMESPQLGVADHSAEFNFSEAFD
jgi:hypothetical protein